MINRKPLFKSEFKGEFESASIRMDMTRGIAASAIVIHHWILFMPHKSPLPIFYNAAEMIGTIAGTTVHLFFILSGFGLTISYFKSNVISWKDWSRRRFRKVIFPYWIIIILIFLSGNVIHYIAPALFKRKYSSFVLLTYLTLTRNFFNLSWEMNPTLWFIPAIIGLYVLFPFLIRILERYGAFFVLILSIIITYLSITLCIILKYPVKHQSSLPLFFLSEFVLGMYIGYILCFYTDSFNRFIGLKTFVLGIGFYCLSWVINRNWGLGPEYNDLFTAIGIFFITLNICHWMVGFSPEKSVKILRELSKQSYVMYLLHGAIILFFIRPIWMYKMQYPLNSAITIVLSFFYCFMIFLLARIFSPFINVLYSFFMNSFDRLIS